MSDMRVPLAEPAAARDSTRTNGAWAVNVFMDVDGQRQFLTKRPGMELDTGLGTLQGQGLFNYNDEVYAIADDKLHLPLTRTDIHFMGRVNTGTAILGISTDGNGWVRSLDGVTYTAITLPAVTSPQIQIYAFGATYLTSDRSISSVNFVYKSVDDGDNWTEVSLPGDFPAVGSDHSLFLGHDATTLYLYLAEDGSTTYIRWASPDGGTTWGTGGTIDSFDGTNRFSFAPGAVYYAVTGKQYMFIEGLDVSTSALISSGDGFASFAIEKVLSPPQTVMGLWVQSGVMYRAYMRDVSDLLLRTAVLEKTSNGVSWGSVKTFRLSFDVFESFITVLSGDLLVTFGGVNRDPGLLITFPAPITLSVTSAGLPFDPIQTPLSGGLPGAFFKSTKDAFYFDGTTVTKVTDSDYPAETTRGVTCLDSTFYVMDPKGIIYGSDLNAPLSWDALNFLTAQMEPDGGVYLARLLNFIIAFGEYTTEFFYDAGNPTGSPLSPYTSSMLNIGCAIGGSVAQSNNQIIFMAVTKQKGRSIYVLTGTAPSPISTPAIDRILNADDLAAVSSFCVKISGHNFYVLTLGTVGVTLAYDFTTQDWKEWSSLELHVINSSGPVSVDAAYSAVTGLVTAVSIGNGIPAAALVTVSGADQVEYNGTFQVTILDSDTFTYLPELAPSTTPATGVLVLTFYTPAVFQGKFYTGFGNVDATQLSNGDVYTMGEEVYQDGDLPVDVTVTTSLMDGGADSEKFFRKLHLIADQENTTVRISYSGDDYQTFSSPRALSLANRRALLTRLGRDRRRAFKIYHRDNTLLRLEALELTLDKGSN